MASLLFHRQPVSQAHELCCIIMVENDEKKNLNPDFSAYTANITLTVIHQWQASRL
jgi:hypothetical protein